MAEQPLFDPSRIYVPPAERVGAAGPGADIPFLVTPRQVNDLVRGAVEKHLPATLHVLGEVADLSQPKSGHIYFTLKDAHSELRAVLWRSNAVRLKFRPEDGMQVIATGGIEVYTPRGSYQLIVRRLEPRGVGALEVAFRQLKEKLAREGLFDARRKKPLPKIPRRVAIVTSPSGAAVRDILRTIGRRYPAVEVLVFPVHVQGEQAAPEIAQAIRLLSEHSQALGGIDVLIVGRGGGSLEDLWAFNTEIVARAIAGSRIPVVSAVGHEVDVTISDLVADVRAATPTAAAELVTPVLSELLEALGRETARIGRALRHALDVSRHRLERTLAYDGLARPLGRLRERAQQIDELMHGLRVAFSERFRAVRERLVHEELIVLRFGSGATFARIAQQLDRRVFDLRRRTERRLLAGERRLHALLNRAALSAPARGLERADEQVRQARQRLDALARQALAHRHALLEARLEAVAACDPKRVLRRGYSITRDANTRRVIRSTADIRDGQRILSEVSDGEFPSRVENRRQPRLFE